jgi:hypothetical protein
MNNTDKNQLLYYLFITALEGGINYWARVTEYEPEGEFYATIIDVSENTTYRVDRQTISNGLALAKEYEKDIWSVPELPHDWDDFDAGDADVVLQLGLFGEIIFG